MPGTQLKTSWFFDFFFLSRNDTTFKGQVSVVACVLVTSVLYTPSTQNYASPSTGGEKKPATDYIFLIYKIE